MPRRGLSAKAKARHAIPKATLIASLFRALDKCSTGVWKISELETFARSTGYQWDRYQFHEDLWELLEEAAISPDSFEALSITSSQLAQLVHRQGHLPMNKAAIRRTIRYIKMPEFLGLTWGGVDSWHSIKHMMIRGKARHWKQGIPWHSRRTLWFLKPSACSDPNCPLKTHPELFRELGGRS